jgi:hypothetical protein
MEKAQLPLRHIMDIEIQPQIPLSSEEIKKLIRGLPPYNRICLRPSLKALILNGEFGHQDNIRQKLCSVYSISKILIGPKELNQIFYIISGVKPNSDVAIKKTFSLFEIINLVLEQKDGRSGPLFTKGWNNLFPFHTTKNGLVNGLIWVYAYFDIGRVWTLGTFNPILTEINSLWVSFGGGDRMFLR